MGVLLFLAMSNISQELVCSFCIYLCCFFLWILFSEWKSWTTFNNGVNRLYSVYLGWMFTFPILKCCFEALGIKKNGGHYFFHTKVKGRRQNMAFYQLQLPSFLIFLDLRIESLWELTIRYEDSSLYTLLTTFLPPKLCTCLLRPVLLAQQFRSDLKEAKLWACLQGLDCDTQEKKMASFLRALPSFTKGGCSENLFLKEGREIQFW